MQTLQCSLDALTKASVESVLHRLMNYIARPLTEFNKYEALEMTEKLQNSAHDRKHPKERYYRVVYQTIREKMEVPPAQFRALLLRLLGDKEQERVSEIVSKVEKNFTRKRTQGARSTPAYSTRGRSGAPWTNTRCFYCNKVGHLQSHCVLRRGDSQHSVRQRHTLPPNREQST